MNNKDVSVLYSECVCYCHRCFLEEGWMFSSYSPSRLFKYHKRTGYTLLTNIGHTHILDARTQWTCTFTHTYTHTHTHTHTHTYSGHKHVYTHGLVIHLLDTHTLVIHAVDARIGCMHTAQTHTCRTHPHCSHPHPHTWHTHTGHACARHTHWSHTHTGHTHTAHTHTHTHSHCSCMHWTHWPHSHIIGTAMCTHIYAYWCFCWGGNTFSPVFGWCKWSKRLLHLQELLTAGNPNFKADSPEMFSCHYRHGNPFAVPLIPMIVHTLVIYQTSEKRLANSGKRGGGGALWGMRSYFPVVQLTWLNHGIINKVANGVWVTMINVSLPWLFGGSQRWMVLCLLHRVTYSSDCCYVWFKGWHTVVNVAVSGLGGNIQWWMLLCLVQGVTYSGECCCVWFKGWHIVVNVAVSGSRGNIQWWMVLWFSGSHAVVNVAVSNIQGHTQWWI